MRRIVTRGLYTFMEGMFSSTEFTDNVGMNEPLRQDKNKKLAEPSGDGEGLEESIAGSKNVFTATQSTSISKSLQVNHDGRIVTVYPIPPAVRENVEVGDLCIHEKNSSGVQVAQKHLFRE